MSQIKPYQSNSSSKNIKTSIENTSTLIEHSVLLNTNLENYLITMILKEYEAIRKVIANIGIKYEFSFCVYCPADTIESPSLCNYVATKLFDGMIKILTISRKLYGDLNKRKPKAEMNAYEQYRKIFEIYKEFLIRMQ